MNSKAINISNNLNNPNNSNNLDNFLDKINSKQKSKSKSKIIFEKYSNIELENNIEPESELDKKVSFMITPALPPARRIFMKCCKNRYCYSNCFR